VFRQSVHGTGTVEETVMKILKKQHSVFYQTTISHAALPHENLRPSGVFSFPSARRYPSQSLRNTLVHKPLIFSRYKNAHFRRISDQIFPVMKYARPARPFFNIFHRN